MLKYNKITIDLQKDYAYNLIIIIIFINISYLYIFEKVANV
jgi:hypothetical protein